MPKKEINNPFAKWYNKDAFTPIRAFFKNKKTNHHNTILPQTQNHGPLILGAIPTQEMLNKIAEENDNPIIVRVSMLTHGEESAIHYNEPQNSIHISLFDHSAMNSKTGKNITIEEIQEQMDKVANNMKEGKAIYFHCLAGHSRSCFAIVSYLYLHPEFLDGTGLSNPPTLREIASYVKKQHPEVTNIDELKSGQKGLLGLLALNEHTKRLKEKTTSLDTDEAKKIAEEISFMLYAPLDNSFRKSSDRTKQEENFAELYTIYKQAEKNLLLQMLPKGINTLDSFTKLSSSEKAHFLILAQCLISKGATTKEDLEKELGYTIEFLVQRTTAKTDELTSGDMVELFRTFGATTGLTFIDIATKITTGNNIDRYNAGTQLAELLSIAKNNNLIPHDQSIINYFIKKLSSEEQDNFDDRMASLGLNPKDFSNHRSSRIPTQGWITTQNPLLQKEPEETSLEDQKSISSISL